MNQFITLKFSVSGSTPIEIEKINLHQPLKVGAQKALKEAGATRPIKDYDALYNDNPIDLDKKVEFYELSDGAEITLSLGTGQGG